ncbi:MAG: DUF6807 family protein [Planctomycetota bacterium]
MNTKLLIKTLPVFIVISSLGVASEPNLLEIEIAKTDRERTNFVVKTLVDIPQSPAVVMMQDESGNSLLGQVSAPGIEFKNPGNKNQLTLIIPKISAGKSLRLSAKQVSTNSRETFEWHDDHSTQSELRYGDQAVAQYKYESVDDSTPQRRQETYKVFHHVFSPDGNLRLTKGPGGTFPHHRGIFFGYNRISYEGKKADVWHCKSEACQVHAKSNEQIGGPVFGRDQNSIIWRGSDGNPFAQETRQLTFFKLADGNLIEFHSTLRSLGSKIVFKGDPQHAGVQFRATQRVPDETKEKTYYIRPDGKAKPGVFRNWSNKKGETEINKSHVDLPWNTLCFYVDDQLFSCCYLDSPTNPKPARFSERDYGRFGSYFEATLSPDKPLSVSYRFWLQNGELSIERANSLSLDFVDPAKLTIYQ